MNNKYKKNSKHDGIKLFLKSLKTSKNEYKQLGINQKRIRWIHHNSNCDNGGEFYGYGAG